MGLRRRCNFGRCLRLLLALGLRRGWPLPSPQKLGKTSTRKAAGLGDGPVGAHRTLGQATVAACNKSLAPRTPQGQDTDIQARRPVRKAPSLPAAVIERAPSVGHSAKKGPTPTDPPHTPSVKSHTTEMTLWLGEEKRVDA